MNCDCKELVSANERIVFSEVVCSTYDNKKTSNLLLTDKKIIEYDGKLLLIIPLNQVSCIRSENTETSIYVRVVSSKMEISFCIFNDPHSADRIIQEIAKRIV